MHPNEENPWTINTKNEVYDNPWITVTHHEVSHVSGHIGIYGTVHFKKIALGVLVLDDDYNTWIVGQYRFPIKQYSWELPEGGGDLNIDPLVSIKRELLEEAGIIAQSWHKIQTMYLSNSTTDEIAHLYIAKNLTFKVAQPDNDELLKQKKLPFNELYNMVINGQVTDAMTITTVLKAKLLMLEGKL
ncbi:MAG: NUDIX hydrolase [Bacteroidia bacterium]|nr:NUDIX hydrolase [Bacteroidia bacterium]